MFRIAGLVGMMFALTLVAQEPKQGDVPSQDDLSKKPQWQRMLTGADLKKAKGLEENIGALKEANETTEALKLA